MYIDKLKQIAKTIDTNTIDITGVNSIAIILFIIIASIINLLYLYIVILIIFTYL